MKQKQIGKHPQRTREDHNYSGKFSDQQAYGNNFQGHKYGEVQSNSLNNYQNFLYNRALFGLSVYSPEEVKKMRWDKKKRIINVHKRSQRILNIWKQEIVNAWTSKFFQTLFPKSPITQEITEMTDTDPAYVSKMSFSDLRVTKAQVISKLVAEGILPSDFYTLKPENLCK